MDKNNIINYWSYQKPTKSIVLQDYLANELSKFYSELNNLELVNLNLLDESFKYYYWFICNKTGLVYFINLIIDSREYQLSKNMIEALSEINHLVFKQIDFEIEQVDEITNQIKLSNIYTLTVNPSDVYGIKSTKYFVLSNITVHDKSVLNVNKPSRTIRYIRRQILRNSKKRPSQDFEEPSQVPYKRRRTQTENVDNWKDMISASSVRNYLLNDPLIDYLKEYNIHSISDKPYRIPNSKTSVGEFINVNSSFDTFTKCILDAGVEFEEELVKIIKKKHKVAKVAELFQAKNKDKFDETIKLMKQGVPIIYQAVLHNFDNKTFGMPDLLVRSDYLNKLMGYQVISSYEEKVGSKLGTNFHYKVIDIKHSTIPLRADGIHILNSESIPAYKGQLYIYTRALNSIQEIDIDKAFIWGKKYYWESKGEKYESTDFLNKLGIVDFNDIDSQYVKQTEDAIQWIKTVKNEGSNWKLLPIPCRAELFPNMKNEKDGVWRKVKNELNSKIDEITSVVYCGIKQRECAHQSKVYKWSDPKCTAKVMGFNPNGKNSIIVDSVLNINRQSDDIIRPNKIIWQRDQWLKPKKDTLEFFLDFETLNSNFGSIIKDGIISYSNNQYIFMIGLGYQVNNNWVFKTFIMEEKKDSAELKMFREFYQWIETVLKTNRKKKARFYHWSHAEPIAYKSFKNRNPLFVVDDNHFEFYDLYQVFVNEPIVIKGALNYSLKTIAKVLKSQNLIETCWEESSPCSNGLTAMILANKVYENFKNKLIDCVRLEPVMKEIIKYNHVDCRVVYEILQLIRNMK